MLKISVEKIDKILNVEKIYEILNTKLKILKFFVLLNTIIAIL